VFGLERRAEAKKITLSCVADLSDDCLYVKISIANGDPQNQYDILLGNRPIRLRQGLTVTTPNWLQIFGNGSGVTSIHGSCFPPAAKKGEDPKEIEKKFYGGTEEDFYKSPGLNGTAECPQNVNEFPALWVKDGGVLVLDKLSIGNAQTGLEGAGIRNEGTLLVYESSIMHNHTHGSGGGIYHNGPWLYLQDTMVNNNIAHNGAGGGIFIAGGRVDIQYSTIHSNWTAPEFPGTGGGIVNGTNDEDRPLGGALYIVNSTISKNIDNSFSTQDHKAGGITQLGIGEVWLKNVTITDNLVASPGHTNYGHGIFGAARFYLANSIIAENGGDVGPECGGLVITLGGNLVGTNSGCYIVPPDNYIKPLPDNWPKPQAHDLIGDVNASTFDKRYIDPLFEEGGPNDRPLLKDNGGNTCTVPIRNQSPAVGNGWKGAPGSHPLACDEYDQRWVSRYRGLAWTCDIGAYEYRGQPTPSGLTCPDK
jgi:hypothetical protein